MNSTTKAVPSCKHCGEAIEPSGGKLYPWTHCDANQTKCRNAEPIPCRDCGREDVSLCLECGHSQTGSDSLDALQYALECLTRPDDVDAVYRMTAIQKIKAAIRGGAVTATAAIQKAKGASQ